MAREKAKLSHTSRQAGSESWNSIVTLFSLSFDSGIVTIRSLVQRTSPYILVTMMSRYMEVSLKSLIVLMNTCNEIRIRIPTDNFKV